MVKNLLAKAGDAGLIPGLGRSLEKKVATHFSILTWKIPWTEEPGGLQSTGLQRVRQDLVIERSTHTSNYSTLNFGEYLTEMVYLL